MTPHPSRVLAVVASAAFALLPATPAAAGNTPPVTEAEPVIDLAPVATDPAPVDTTPKVAPTIPDVTIGEAAELGVVTEWAVAGEPLTITGTGFGASEIAVVLDDTDVVGTASPDASGAFEVTVTLPADVATGDGHVLRAVDRVAAETLTSADSRAPLAALDGVAVEVDVVTAEFAAAAVAVAELMARTSPAAAPVGENPNGRTITLVDTSAEVGGTIRFTGTGYLATDGHGGGQLVTVKINDGDILGQALADASGNLEGSVTVPSFVTPGGTYWLRFLAGAGQADDMPPSSIFAYFTVAGDVATTTTTTVPAGSDTTTTTTVAAGGSSDTTTTTTVGSGGSATTTTVVPGGSSATTTTVPAGSGSVTTTTTASGGTSGATTTTTVAGRLVSSGDDADRALTAAGVLAVLGAGGLVLTRRLRRSEAGV